MFLSLLSETQKVSFAKVARYVIAADDVVDENEQWLMHLSLQEMGLGEWPAPPESEAEFLAELKTFDNPISKNILLIEILCMALADGEIEPREEDVIEQIVKDRRIRHSRMADFRSYAAAYLDLVERGEELIMAR